MACSILLSLASAGFLAGALAAAEPAAPSPAPPQPATTAPAEGNGTPKAVGLQSNLPIQLTAGSWSFDLKKNLVVFKSVIITQGTLRLDATEAAATGFDMHNFENSQWHFTGDVHIRMEKGSLTSDKADVTFAKNQIARALITGAPASFEQTLEQPPQTARGRANTIDYDVARGTVRLSQNAWLSDGNNEVSGDVLVYDVRAERVVANAPTETSGRVQITINPNSKKPPAAPTSPKQ